MKGMPNTLQLLMNKLNQFINFFGPSVQKLGICKILIYFSEIAQARTGPCCSWLVKGVLWEPHHIQVPEETNKCSVPFGR